MPLKAAGRCLFFRCQFAIYCFLAKKVGVCAGSVKRDGFFLNGEYQKPVRLYVTRGNLSSPL